MMKSIAQNLLIQYQTQLDQYFAIHQDATTALSTWLATQFSKSQLIQLLTSILADQHTLTEISARSYRHGNGFLKVVLLDRGFKLRLHIWFAGQACEENIHDHRWSFSSLILTGALTSEIWKDHAHGQQLQEYEYHAATKSHAPFKINAGMQTLKLDHLQHNIAGESYVMPKGKLHRIINPGHQVVATMMCSGPTEQGTTRLIPIHDGIDPNIQPPKTNTQQLAASLTQFIQYLQQEEQINVA
ncbi:hypothetical protein [Acinetobacter guillouiae]|uniref:hypothetical protein n=2 Tax=Acinetobacter guillouiae TaxID=106649 RepID=UPI003AF987A8